MFGACVLSSSTFVDQVTLIMQVHHYSRSGLMRRTEHTVKQWAQLALSLQNHYEGGLGAQSEAAVGLPTKEHDSDGRGMPTYIAAERVEDTDKNGRLRMPQVWLL